MNDRSSERWKIPFLRVPRGDPGPVIIRVGRPWLGDSCDGTADTGVWLLGAAAGVGLVHAAFTVYWASGGRWLLRTVGAWAVHLADSNPVAGAAVIGVVAVLKIAASLIPLTVEVRPFAGRRLWWRLVAVGAIGLFGFGLHNVVVSWAVLGGLVTPTGGYDRAAQFGHAALWDPLFHVWGLLLAGGLRLTRTPVARPPVVPVSAG